MEKIKDLIRRVGKIILKKDYKKLIINFTNKLNNLIKQAVKEMPVNINYWKRKIGIYTRRFFRSIKRSFRRKQVDRVARKLAYNLDLEDMENFFNPQLCYILTTKTKDRRANMSPVKWLSVISLSPPIVMMALLRNKIAYRNIKKYKSFSLSMINRGYISDYGRLTNIGDNEAISMISRFRASPAFFINGYNVRGFPWIECSLDRIVEIDKKTTIVVGKILHISKIRLNLRDKLLHCFGNSFLNPQRFSITKSGGEKK